MSFFEVTHFFSASSSNLVNFEWSGLEGSLECSDGVVTGSVGQLEFLAASWYL